MPGYILLATLTCKWGIERDSIEHHKFLAYKTLGCSFRVAKSFWSSSMSLFKAKPNIYVLRSDASLLEQFDDSQFDRTFVSKSRL